MEHDEVTTTRTPADTTDRRPSHLMALTLVVVAIIAGVVVGYTVGERMNPPAQTSVDVGFLQDMISHHEQAIQLGLLGVANAQSPDVQHFAQEAIVAQQYEIGYMTAILEEWGYDTGDVNRDTMTWMSMPTSVENMPGMASTEELTELRAASGEEADELFLELMTEHHKGGIHMAEYTAANGDDPRVTELAARMAANQTKEIAEYDAVAQRLGY